MKTMQVRIVEISADKRTKKRLHFSEYIWIEYKIGNQEWTKLGGSWCKDFKEYKQWVTKLGFLQYDDKGFLILK